MELKKILSGIKINKLTEKLSDFLKKKSKWILFAVLLAFITYCVYLWYNYAYNPKWDKNKRQEYISTKGREAVFNKAKFEMVIKEIENRKIESEKKIENVPDIFRLK